MIRLVFIVFKFSWLCCTWATSFHKRATRSQQKQIDKIDRQIVELINQRAAVVEKVGKIEAAAGLPVTVPSREQEVLKRVAEIDASLEWRCVPRALKRDTGTFSFEDHDPTSSGVVVAYTSHA